MYAICICEKDFTYLNSLRSAIPWNELGYSLMESFTSADQAIIYLQSSPSRRFYLRHGMWILRIREMRYIMNVIPKSFRM